MRFDQFRIMNSMRFKSPYQYVHKDKIQTPHVYLYVYACICTYVTVQVCIYACNPSTLALSTVQTSVAFFPSPKKPAGKKHHQLDAVDQ